MRIGKQVHVQLTDLGQLPDPQSPGYMATGPAGRIGIRRDVFGVRMGSAQSSIQPAKARRELCRSGLGIQQPTGADFSGRGALGGKITRDRHWAFFGEAASAHLLRGAGDGLGSHRQLPASNERSAKLTFRYALGAAGDGTRDTGARTWNSVAAVPCKYK